MRACAVALWILVGVSACRRAEAPPTPPEHVQAHASEPATYDGALTEPEAPRDEPDAEAKPKPPRPPNTIFRSEVERALSGGPAYLLDQLGPEPYRVEGKFVGWEITRLFPDDPGLCDPCDLAIGDVIVEVNGDRLETPDAFAAMVGKAPKLESLVVRSLRDQQRRVVKYSIAED
jgi:type II secretory pathway component PulC